MLVLTLQPHKIKLSKHEVLLKHMNKYTNDLISDYQRPKKTKSQKILTWDK